MPRTVLITGASRGIGHATARLLGDGDWNLALAARSPIAFDGAHLPLCCDVTDEAAVRTAIRQTGEHFGALDAVVCAAGSGSFPPTVESTLDDWNQTIGANLTGTYLVCREALRVMLPEKSGHLVNILSVAAKNPFPGAAAYVASKWGAYGLTKSLAEEVRRDGIRVTAILPGSVDTPFWDRLGGTTFDRAEMLRPEAVAEAIRWALDAPPNASVDEIHLMPPRGIL